MKNENHIYDGIVEENNPMPDWWVWLFIFTVIFGFIYWLHYQFGGGPTLKDEYNMAMQTYEKKIAEGGKAQDSDTEESLAELMKNELSLTAGATLFNEKCAMCHGTQLEGKVGPNLTDNFWIHGTGKRLDIVDTIKKGVPSKGMPPWEGLLKPNEVKKIAVYVYSKIGSKPANAKTPEGQEIK